jgi:mRNA interferase MazF
MFEFGSIVLTRFPFTDLSGGKIRPALVVSRDNYRRADVVLAFITARSHAAANPDAPETAPTRENGLKVDSVVRFDKLATLERRVVVGKIGDADSAFLSEAKSVFYGVFGFDTP